MAKVVICGRPNVGKSTLFNRLSGKGVALVHDRPGVTRDWVHVRLDDLGVDLVDTAGMADGLEDGLAEQAWKDSLGQIDAADLALLVVDGKGGLSPLDVEIAKELRKKCSEERIVLVVNKTENLEAAMALSEFHALGLDPMVPVSAAHGLGLNDLTDLLASYSDETSLDGQAELEQTKIAIIGRPNVGKSTLANKLLGQERMMVSDRPGTTVDSVMTGLEHKGKRVVLVDTAGIRRKAKVVDPVETHSTRKARFAAQEADVVLFLADASEGVVHQDQLLANLVAGYGRATVVILNKSDLLSPQERRKATARAKRELPFMDHAEMLLTSVGSPGFRKGKVLDMAFEAHRQACQRFSPNRISRSLLNATKSSNPPRSHGKRPSLRYAHQAGMNPPLIVIHGRHVDLVKDSYLRYLANRFAEDLGYHGAPLHIRLKESKGKEARRS